MCFTVFIILKTFRLCVLIAHFIPMMLTYLCSKLFASPPTFHCVARLPQRRPFFHQICIHGGCAKWLDSHTFVQLTSFSIGGMLRNAFPNRVYMPACAHISFGGFSLESLPTFQAALVSPLIAEWDLREVVLSQEHFHTADGATHPVVSALNKIHARVLRFTIDLQYEHLITVIQLRHELEELSIQFNTHVRVVKEFLIALTEIIVDYSPTKTTNTSFDTQPTPTLAIATSYTCHGSERKIICPNLKVLGLKFWSVQSDKRGEIRQWCVQMMEGRRRAGYPLSRCCIWWHRDDHKNDPSLVLFASNEGIITDE